MSRFAVSWTKYNEDVHKLATKILKGSPVLFNNIYAVPRGGLVIGVHLSHILKLPLVSELDKHRSIHTLVVDDVSDTGRTLRNLGVLSCSVATLYRKDGNLFEPFFSVETINEWIEFPWEQ